jgi:molybdopterin converting factor small subunit
LARILYFGRLAEALGRADEQVRLGADGRPAGDLRRLHSALGAPEVKLVVNRELASDDTPVSDNDEIAFLPPVSGG